MIPAGSAVVLVGPPGAGKTTVAAALVAAGVVAPADVLEADALRAALTGDPGDTSRDRAVFARIRAELDQRMAAGRTTVVDATGLWPRRRARHVAVARAHDRPAVAVRFEEPLDVLLRRNAARDRQVPSGGVVLMARQLQSGSRPGDLLAEGFDVVLDAADVRRALPTLGGAASGPVGDGDAGAPRIGSGP